MKLLRFISLLLITTSINTFASSISSCGVDGQNCIQYGAEVFQNRCSLCHGSDGLGEGILALTIKNYPNTNLLLHDKEMTRTEILEVIQLGGSLDFVSSEMPPWGDELTHSQLESVTDFVLLLRSDINKAKKLLVKAANKQKPNIKIGRGIFKGRCSLCHGDQGEGDGKMAKIIKNPPPFNLTLSVMPDEYLRLIISKGGEKMGRSNRMPPWGGDLSVNEINSVILYIKSLRHD